MIARPLVSAAGGGRIGVYIHYAGDDVLDDAKQAYLNLFSENGLGPKAGLSMQLRDRNRCLAVLAVET